MYHAERQKRYQRPGGSLRWLVAGLTLLIVLLFLIPGEYVFATRPSRLWIALEIILIFILGGLAYLLVDRLFRMRRENELLQERVREGDLHMAEARSHLATVFRVSQLYAQAEREEEIVQQLLQLSIETVGARGASFVPIDERGQPKSAVNQGELPLSVAEAWLEYLATPSVRQTCLTCQHQEQLNHSCQLLRSSFLDVIGMFCIPVRRGDQEFGVLNLYLPSLETLDEELQAFLRAIVDETALALEGVRLRQRELAAFRQLQAVQEKTDLHSLLSGLLENLQATLEADYAEITVGKTGNNQLGERVIRGEMEASAEPMIEGILRTTIASQEPVILGNIASDPQRAPGLRAIMAAPLMLQGQPAMGAMLVANLRSRAFNQRQFSMLQTVAGQVAFVLKNVRTANEHEVKAVIQERTRLAREIHDGLAQTLGFLKLKAAQMRTYADHLDWEAIRKSIDMLYDALAAAYQDARQAIDDLRISPAENGLAGWLCQVVEDFREYSGLEVTYHDPGLEVELPPEVHSQLIRIVQEALNNIRKHAQAEQVWVSCQETGGDLLLEVRDDGIGFSPEDLPGASQYGLRSMRERAELLGADFQIIREPQRGTTVRVRLPLPAQERIA
jgi:two-component system nitrate/nitrite sensor histidine kinase NarX